MANDTKNMDAKGMIENAVKDKAVIKYKSRLTLEVIEDTKFYKKGQIITPHKLMGEQLIKDKIAKLVK